MVSSAGKYTLHILYVDVGSFAHMFVYVHRVAASMCVLGSLLYTMLGAHYIGAHII